MIKLQYMTEYVIKLCFIPLVLKDNGKKWLYSIPTNSTCWDEFTTVFLKHILPCI